MDSILALPYLELRCVVLQAPSYLGKHYSCGLIQGKQPCEGLSHEKKKKKRKNLNVQLRTGKTQQRRAGCLACHGLALQAKTRSSAWIQANYLEDYNKWAAPENAVLYASLKNGFLHVVGKIRLKSRGFFFFFSYSNSEIL